MEEERTSSSPEREEDAALSEELLTCGRDYVRAQQIAARQTEIAAKSDQLYEEYGTLIE